jgi:hypothetical protein
MPRRSPKRKDTPPKKSMEGSADLKSGSDYRLIIVLGGAVLLAIAIIVVILWTIPA